MTSYGHTNFTNLLEHQFPSERSRTKRRIFVTRGAYVPYTHVVCLRHRIQAKT